MYNFTFSQKEQYLLITTYIIANITIEFGLFSLGFLCVGYNKPNISDDVVKFKVNKTWFSLGWIGKKYAPCKKRL